MPKVSILVPCCNVEKYVEECLVSIKNQTLQDIEVICINDGSKDSTLEVIKKCAEGDDRFVVLDKPNSGYGDSMNLGLSLANGEYVGIVESDDFVELNMFELLYTKAKEFDLDVSRACYSHFKNGKDKADYCPRLPKNHLCAPVHYQNIFLQAPSIWAAIYKTSWLKSSGIEFLPTPGASFQDTSFAFKSNLMANRYMVQEDCLLHYRQHDANSVKSKKNVFTVCDEYAECIRYAKEKGMFNEVKHILLQMQYVTYKWNYFRLDKQEAAEFYRRWVDEWKKFRDDEGIEFQSLPKKFRHYFKWITEYPSVFEIYLKCKHD